MYNIPTFIANIFWLAILLLFAAMVVTAIVAKRSRHRRSAARVPQKYSSAQLRQSRPRYVGQTYAPVHTLLTEAEQRFFETLRVAVPPELLICPQVRLANLVRPTARNAKQHKYDFYRIQAKCVDFVLCDAGTTTPRLVIELDDASHQRADRQKRDEFVDMVLGQVGLPILHVPWQRSYDTQALAEAIRRQVPGFSALPIAVQTQAPVLANGWSSPIKIATLVESQAALVPEFRTVTYVCGQCQREVRRDAKFCNQCGASL